MKDIDDGWRFSVTILLFLFLLLVAVVFLVMTNARAADIPPAYQKIAHEYGVAPAELYALALRFSKGWPWTVTVEGAIKRYASKAQAQAAIAHYWERGQRRIKVGLMQIAWIPEITPVAALDPWYNTRTGAALLQRGIVPADPGNRYQREIEQISHFYQLDPQLVKAVIRAESNFNSEAVSPAGAQGLMQLMPATAERFGVKSAFHPRDNIRGGVRYLQWLLNRFEDLPLALAGYNAGEGAVERYGRTIPPYKETQQYVSRVLSFYEAARWSVAP